MDKLISQDALLNILRNGRKECHEDAEAMGGKAVIAAELFDDVITTVEDMPTMDVAPVVHSGWVLDGSDEYADHYHCGKCGAEIDLCNEIYTELTPNYCPHCGAKMDGGTT